MTPGPPNPHEPGADLGERVIGPDDPIHIAFWGVATGGIAQFKEGFGGEEVEYVVGLPGEGAEAEVFFSDLSHEYVTINAEYTT